MRLVEGCEFFEWVITNDIAVENKEGRVVLSKYAFSKLERTGSTQRFSLYGEADADVVKLLVLWTVLSVVLFQSR